MARVVGRRRFLSACIAILTLWAPIGGALVSVRTAGAQSAINEGIDFGAIAIRPTDFDTPGWRHLGAFVDGLTDTAKIVAAYRGRGTSTIDVAAHLLDSGWQREYVANLGLPSVSNPDTFKTEVRSYVTVYADPAGATAGFAYLEDESGVPGAADVAASRTYGEESEVTSERGTGADGRTFGSLDLTFRAGFLVAGVTLIQYPTDAGIDPDSAELERLATLLEQRVTAASIHGTSPGAVVVRLDPATPDLVSYDDAYYRWAGTNIPQQSGESESQEGSRLQSYRGSTDVYQLWQGVPDRSGNVMLYGVTLLRFPDEAAAGDWVSNLQTILSANSFYANLTPVSLSAPLGDQRVGLTYRAGGASGPHAALVAVRVGSTVARVHLVGSGAMTSVPISALELLASAQADCLGDPTCSHTTAWPLPLNG